MENDYQHYVDFGKPTFSSLPLAPQLVKGARMEHDKTHSEIGDRIDHVRTAFTTLTQKEFAERMGYNYGQFNNWTRGERRIPIEAALKLAQTYGLTLDWIYLGRRDGLAETASKVL